MSVNRLREQISTTPVRLGSKSKTKTYLLIRLKFFFIFEGYLTKDDGTVYANADNVALTNNGIMHIFSNFKFQLSNQEIESLYYPGQGTTMLGLLNYPDDFSMSQGLNKLWYKDTTATAAVARNHGFSTRQTVLIRLPDPKGTFSFRVPLKHIFWILRRL